MEKKMKTASIVQDDPDEHVFVIVECPGRPAISIDIMNLHGRRFFGVRVNGISIFNGLLDLEELKPKGESTFRYCGMCGEKIELTSSWSHNCKSEEKDQNEA
jgi:hypothetical protein